jgi:hypothetical protein
MLRHISSLIFPLFISEVAEWQRAHNYLSQVPVQDYRDELHTRQKNICVATQQKTLMKEKKSDKFIT